MGSKLKKISKWWALVALVFVTTVYAFPIKEKAGEVISFFIGGVKQVEIVESGIVVPTGTDAQQPAGVPGMLRYNTDKDGFEGYANGKWGAVGGIGAEGIAGEALEAGDVLRGEDGGGGNIKLFKYPLDSFGTGVETNSPETVPPNTVTANYNKIYNSTDDVFTYMWHNATTKDLNYSTYRFVGTNPANVEVTYLSTATNLVVGDWNTFKACQSPDGTEYLAIGQYSLATNILQIVAGTKNLPNDITWGTPITAAIGTSMHPVGCDYDPINNVFVIGYTDTGATNLIMRIVTVAGTVPTVLASPFTGPAGYPTWGEMIWNPTLSKMIVYSGAGPNEFLYQCDNNATLVTACGAGYSIASAVSGVIKLTLGDSGMLVSTGPDSGTVRTYDISVDPIVELDEYVNAYMVSTSSVNERYGVAKSGLSGSTWVLSGNNSSLERVSVELDINPSTGVITAGSTETLTDNNPGQRRVDTDNAGNWGSFRGSLNGLAFDGYGLAYGRSFDPSVFAGVSTQAAAPLASFDYIPNGGVIGDLTQLGTPGSGAYMDGTGGTSSDVIHGTKIGTYLNENQVQIQVSTGSVGENAGFKIKALEDISKGQAVVMGNDNVNSTSAWETGVYAAREENSVRFLKLESPDLDHQTATSYDYVNDIWFTYNNGNNVQKTKVGVVDKNSAPSWSDSYGNGHNSTTGGFYNDWTHDTTYSSTTNTMINCYIYTGGQAYVRSYTYNPEGKIYNMLEFGSLNPSNTSSRWVNCLTTPEGKNIFVYSNPTVTYGCMFDITGTNKKPVTSTACAVMLAEGTRYGHYAWTASDTTTANDYIYKISASGTSVYQLRCDVDTVIIDACAETAYAVLPAGINTGSYGYGQNDQNGLGRISVATGGQSQGIAWRAFIALSGSQCSFVKNGVLEGTITGCVKPVIVRDQTGFEEDYFVFQDSNTGRIIAGRVNSSTIVDVIADLELSTANRGRYVQEAHAFHSFNDYNTPDSGLQISPDGSVVFTIESQQSFSYRTKRSLDNILGFAASDVTAGNDATIIPIENGFVNGIAGKVGEYAELDSSGSLIATSLATKDTLGQWVTPTSIKIRK